MIEWFALLLLVPLILVPLVLLFGFSGCHLVFGVDPVGEGPPQLVFQTQLGDEVTRRNRTVVQRLEAGMVTKGGTKVTITIRRPTTGVLHLLNLFISQASNVQDPNRDPYDSAQDQTPVLSEEMYLAPDPSNPTIALPEISYSLDHNQPLLMAFDVGAEGTVPSTAQAVPSFQATAYVGPAPVSGQPIYEASLSDPDGDRQSGYDPQPRILLIQSIEVR